MVEPDHIESWDPDFSIMATQDQCPYFDFDSDLSFVLQTPLIPHYQLHQMQYLAAMEEVHTQSSGYLQDAVVDWTDRCKRRRMLYFPPDDSHTIVSTENYLLNDDYNGLWQDELDANFAWFRQDDACNTLSGLLPSCQSDENGAVSFEKEQTLSSTDEEGTCGPSKPSVSCSELTSTCLNLPEAKQIGCDIKSSTMSVSIFLKGKEKAKVERRRKKPLRVANPFAVVKPSGVQGDVTLSDINKRILRRPTRPIQHPVGEFARLPCAAPDRVSGLSGKAIIALTKIQTQGRGTITIIRTKG
ncbi:XRI1 protein [Nymphaea thermarum]|nr:XRI1 protein [Nymphaea thermarum]